MAFLTFASVFGGIFIADIVALVMFLMIDFNPFLAPFSAAIKEFFQPVGTLVTEAATLLQ